MASNAKLLAELLESDGDVVSSALDNIAGGYYYNNVGAVVGN